MMRWLPQARHARVFRLGLAAILVIAALLRIRGLAFGLPALLDPDEPIFILTAARLLRERTLNPAWFGHPGSTTIYALAVIEAATYGMWHAVGRFADAKAFSEAFYLNPGLVFLPGRIFILICGLLTIVLTHRVARRLFGDGIALTAAALMTVDPLHIRYSQIIRTDMHATVFVLLEILAAIAIVEKGRRRDYLLAAVWLGFACATKWPAAACVAAVAGAAALRLFQHRDPLRKVAANLALYGAVAIAALFVASPYIFLDLPTVLENIRGEERPFHLGATGHGLIGNMAWYVTGPLTFALGLAGVLFAAAGVLIGARRSPTFAATMLPVGLLFFLIITAQALVWERWLVPILPIVTIAAAAGIAALARVAADRMHGFNGGVAQAGMLALVLLAIVPSVQAAHAERSTDTRLLAGAWAKAHIPPGSVVTVEHGAFDILGQPWRFIYPMGGVGCVDVRAALSGRFTYATVDKRRAGRPVVDIGTVDPAKLDTCRGDWGIFVNWDRYRAEPEHFSAEIASYARLAQGGRIAATFYPQKGRVGGPTVRIVRMARRR